MTQRHRLGKAKGQARKGTKDREMHKGRQARIGKKVGKERHKCRQANANSQARECPFCGHF